MNELTELMVERLLGYMRRADPTPAARAPLRNHVEAMIVAASIALGEAGGAGEVDQLRLVLEQQVMILNNLARALRCETIVLGPT